MNKKKYLKSVFIFRRDLRVDDNIGLAGAFYESNIVIPCFIFDEAQVTSKNRFKSESAIQFMLDSLCDLSDQFLKRGRRLYIFYGKPEIIIKTLIKQEKVGAVFVNKDYTPFSKIRDAKIAQVCKTTGVDFNQYSDLLLTEPELVVKNDKKPYTIFTPFYKKASMFKVPGPQKLVATNFHSKKVDGEIKLDQVSKKILKKRNGLVFAGGRSEGLKILRQINDFERYDRIKDIPALDATTHLSAHHKFGTVSIRETYHTIAKTLGKHHSLIRQLFWRDFFTHVAFNFPTIFGHSFHQKYDKIKWGNDKRKFNAWCKGLTGFPIIDAGMRQLSETGFMHNRVRMVVASFLVKDLHIDWRLGERYFATKLVDYDPCVNNGNWQWAASTGCDAQPYFRIFNPWLQQKKFDKDCEYIKKWIPELAGLTSKQIHNYFKAKDLVSGYPLPIVRHEVESKTWLSQIKTLK